MQQQPDLYLEPKWLRYFLLFILNITLHYQVLLMLSSCSSLPQFLHRADTFLHLLLLPLLVLVPLGFFIIIITSFMITTTTVGKLVSTIFSFVDSYHSCQQYHFDSRYYYCNTTTTITIITSSAIRQCFLLKLTLLCNIRSTTAHLQVKIWIVFAPMVKNWPSRLLAYV